MSGETLGERLIRQGKYRSQAEYNSLKESAEREKEATAKVFERVKREKGHTAAEQALRRKGMNPDVIK